MTAVPRWLHRSLAAVTLALVPGCGRCVDAQAGAVRELHGETMGSSYTVKWHGAPTAAVAIVVDEELAAADATFSNWRDDSEIAAFNRHRDTAPFPASDRLRGATVLALQIAAATDGAFDPTIRPLSAAFRAQQRGAAPSDDEFAAARSKVDHRRLLATGTALQKTAAEVEIDLDGVVAGLAADRIGARLAALGVPGFMLEITGEVLCRGRKPDGSPWRIGIVDPERSVPGREAAMLTVPLLDRALCTSGDYRNFTVRDSRVVTHVFDPRTGDNPTHGVVSVSVLARSCALADGLGTALMVLGPAGAEAALARCGDDGAAVWFVLADGDGALRSEAVRWPEAFALDGRPLPRPALARDVFAERERNLAAARQRAAGGAPDPLPDELVDKLVWVGRRLGYLGRYREAIEVYSDGLRQRPDEPHLLRHRGHRFLTVRDFEASRDDLARAAGLVRGKADEVEPDGLPVPGRPPHSTLQFNIHYHLGLAQFCLGDFAAAAAAWEDCRDTARNDEAHVAVAHWLWCARMRLDQKAAAAAVVAALERDLDVVENRSYELLCRVYRGELTEAAARQSAPDAAGSSAALAFGLAHLALVRGEPDAMAQLQSVAARPDWPSFGVLAAEAELARRR